MKKIRSASGIRNKIFYGFAILGTLMFVSGLVSWFELSRLSRATQTIFEESIADMNLSESMLGAVEGQNMALLLMTGEPAQKGEKITIDLDSLFRESRNNFILAFDQAIGLHPGSDKLERIRQSALRYSTEVSRLRNGDIARSADGRPERNPEASKTAEARWYLNEYRLVYYDLTLAIKDFMLLSQQTIDNDTEQIRRNAYRAIMPGIITLGVGIVIILLFFFLIDSYYIRPLLKINKGLRNYLDHKIPFTVSLVGKDELFELKENIDDIMTEIKRRETN